MKEKPIISAERAAGMIKDGWTITTGGFGSCGHPELLTSAIEARFLTAQTPRNLTLVFAAGQGDKDRRGLNRLAHDGLLRRVVGGYWALTPRLGQMAEKNKIEAYNLPQGVVSHLFRAIAGKKPGVITKTGLHTFLDPRYEGGKLNATCKDDLVELIALRGDEHLFYPAFPIHCALLRGTRADVHGNITMEKEANFQDSLAQAQAVRNSGGIVIVQVLEIVEAGTLPPHQIRIPGIFVDYLVQADYADHWQTYGERFNSSYTGASRLINKPQSEPFPLDAKKIIARRAYMETTQRESPIINLGIGTPEYIARVMAEEHDDNVILTVESGAIGGTPAGGLSFGASRNPQAILDQSSQFDFYDGGGIDVAFLGFGQIDRQGNVNVSRLNGKLNGVGGFVNISQSARKVVFCGTFTGRGLGIDTGDGQLRIIREGEIRKFVDEVGQLSFNASFSALKGQEVLYITERAVFRLRGGRLHLIEAAPGVDIDRDILRQIDADVVASDDLRVMDANLFRHARLHDSNGLYKFCT